MKKLVFVFAAILFTSITLNAQKIEMNKVWGGYQFTQDGKSLSLNDMQEIMKSNQEAYDLVQSAKSNKTWGMILGTAGGVLVGFPIGTAIGGGDPEWALAGVGAALIVASIPIVKGFNNKTKKAVELYNNDVTSGAYHFNPSFDLNIKGTSLGIIMSF
ncbi:MAG: hypothetical protein HWD82_04710 [Flavobacteriaceae bacterium]|nr:hypothetical protein [Flavobacteriaceae bacterium]